jgi:hypothetical protein
MKVAFAVFLFLHAFAHAVGVIGVGGLASIEGASGRPSLILTQYAPGDWQVRIMAVAWAIALAGFVFSGIGVLRDADWLMPVLIGSTVLSSLLCLIWAKEAPMGLVANGVIVLVVLVPALSDRLLPA